MDVMDLWRRKAVKLKPWIFGVQCPQQVLVPLDIKIRMQPPCIKTPVPPSSMVSSMRLQISSIEWT
jgi:hypothetical protein